MATKIRMYYNPYLCNVKMLLIDSKGNEMALDGNANDQIINKFGKRFILEDDGIELLDILGKSYRGSKIIIEFVGTEHSYHSMEKICKNNNIELSRSMEIRIHSCDEISTDIRKRVESLKETGFDIDSDGEIDKILDTTIPVVVVGNMSAGKSTFLNALIGEELLPTGQDATTGVICELHHSKTEVSVSYSTNKQKVVIDCVSIDNSINLNFVPEELQSRLRESQKPIERIRRVIDFYNFKDKDNGIDRTVTVEDKLMSICCPFFNANIPEQIVFYDTPGGDSDSNIDDAETLEKALQDQTKGFLIFVCAERKDLDKSQKLIDTIQKATGNKLDLAHTIVVCNQTEEEPDGKVSTSTEKEWASRIVYVSSAVALGARKPAGADTSWKEEKLSKVFKKNKAAFSDPEDDCYTSLPQYCTLPYNRIDGVKDRHEELTSALRAATDEIKAKSLLMQFNSGIDTVEQEIIYVAKELFPYNQCERARKTFIELLEKYKSEIKEKESQKTKQRDSKREQFNSLYEPLCKELEGLTDTFVKTSQSRFSEKYNASPYSYKTNKGELFATKVKDELLKIESYSAESETEIRKKIIQSLSDELSSVQKCAGKDYDDFMKNEILMEYTEKCIEKISRQEGISQQEKEVFADFFTLKNLVDRTAEKRRTAVESTDLDIPSLEKDMCGDKWYTSIWKWCKNKGKEFGYWVKKEFGSKIKGGLVSLYANQYMLFSDDLLEQVNANIHEIFNNVKTSFSDWSSEHNVICGLNKELADIRKNINQLNDEIKHLENKKDRIESELKKLSDIFSKK